MAIRWTTTRLATVRDLIAQGRNAGEIATVIGTTRRAIHHIAAKHDLGPWQSRPGNPAGVKRRSNDAPADFAEAYAAMSERELMARYCRGALAIRRWVAELGLSRSEGWFATRCTRKHAPSPPENKIKLSASAATAFRPLLQRQHRDHSLAGEAAEFLRHYGPLIRVNAQGRYDEKGKYWQRGRYILDGATIVERATRLGFDPDAWRQIA